MTNTEFLAKIKAEIERHINELDISDESILIESELSELLSFLSTLESEKPEADLEKEIETSIRCLNGLHTLENNKSWYKGRYEELKELARHFYELGCRCTAEKYDELEYNRQRKEKSPLPEDTVLFNNGVEEGKRLMMEEAVEGEVMLNPYPTICLDDCKDYDFKDGEKVRVIIIKKED